MLRYGFVSRLFSTKMSMSSVIKAADFAAKKHKDQRRKDPDGTPYINHPIGVCNILINEGKKIQNQCLENCHP